MFVPVLYSYTYNSKQACTVFYEFIMRNKHEVLVRPNYGGLEVKLPAAGGNSGSGGGAPSFW